ncbi:MULTISPECIES: PucR family transcriptional regulator [Streptomycetaceae]|uniref:Putative transcriptional regulator, PucR family n=1 Tax=Streptantibioticus cattleyicolor (strain ATCC 35852 / DSM 46488 / JCM 4925 / NBRC 14057 / NRRL 8057) TaxID=1003195 RepID=F8K1W2_STREN|nr:PucR family transcriptional regulator [Streptantibioticus cattleyicolor]AEW92436.1 putative transcriptional regulator, PucR family [Streptantibioticus cattleyicolor NRRL 8057 = DSM 46488]MYS57244.1 PucR family transcriptional regulator [Streptomyces sp. SID5468]CCB72801.1 Bacterial regulatory helix-turn-helix protein, lysR family [Streptantibioticus cattleyicolor NRRL 8057 = DSM 46488]
MSERKLSVHEPFSRLPPQLHDHFLPYLPQVSEDVVAAIQTQIPEYARPADPTYTRTVRTGVEQGLTLFMERLRQPVGASESVIDTYRSIGRGEANEGRSLDAFQVALRLAARVTWRRINELADPELVPREVLAALGEAILLHLDEIAEATSAGYTEARLRAAGELQRRRRRLLEMLISEPPAPAEVVSDLAHAAQWPVPRDIAVLVVDHAGEPEAAPPMVPPEFLARFDSRPGCVVVPDPDGPGRDRAVDLALRGHRAALGPTVPVPQGARSLRWATEALVLARRGILPGDQVVRCAEHLATMLLFRDEALTDALAARHLGPLQSVRPPHRDRLAETLLCWLQSGRNANEVAVRLGIHPQTVRYRLRQLDDLFGDLLQDPDARFELELVLRAARLREGRGAG